MQRYGETPVTIRTASGKWKLWYRHNGEGRRIRPLKGLPIDVLGDGFTIAPPSWREDLAASYRFRTGGLVELNRLPAIKAGAFDNGFTRAPEVAATGQRNESLWRYCMAQARHCDDVEALLDVAETWASAFSAQLDRDRSLCPIRVAIRNHRPELSRFAQTPTQRRRQDHGRAA